jgi:hypothetical protein
MKKVGWIQYNELTTGISTWYMDKECLLFVSVIGLCNPCAWCNFRCCCAFPVATSTFSWLLLSFLIMIPSCTSCLGGSAGFLNNTKPLAFLTNPGTMALSFRDLLLSGNSVYYLIVRWHKFSHIWFRETFSLPQKYLIQVFQLLIDTVFVISRLPARSSLVVINFCKAKNKVVRYE